MEVFQNTGASFDDASYRLEQDEMLMAAPVYVSLDAAQKAHQAENDSDRTELDVAPAPLAWTLTEDEEGKIWEASDEEIGMIYRVTACPLLG